jgi:hypothetical protein
MPSYKLTGWLEEAARLLVFKESDWSLEKTEALPQGSFIIGNLSTGAKMVAGRNAEGKVEVYGNIDPELQSADSFLMLNAGGDLLMINTLGDFLITEVG